MGKALMGTYATPRSVQLLDEIRALRARVAELEGALAEAEAAAEATTEPSYVALDEPEPVRA